MTISGNKTPHFPEDYDAQIKRTIPYYEQINKETINLILSMDRHPSIWLDTGCGTGTLVSQATEVMPTTKFLLTDPSEKMLEQARIKLANKGNIAFLESMPTQELTCLTDERPDVITAIQCHHYLSRSERKKAVDICYGLLREGGIYVTFENIRPFTDQGIEIAKRRWGRFQLDNGKCKSEVQEHLARFDKEYFPINVGEHLDLLRQAGFGVVEVFWYSCMQAGFYCIK
jgi:tRNA (cmo5U34)-methyltransferase